MKVLILNPNENGKVVDAAVDLDFLQATVGGSIEAVWNGEVTEAQRQAFIAEVAQRNSVPVEAVHVPELDGGGKWTAYANDEFAVNGMPYNLVATVVAHRFGWPGLVHGESLCGPVVFVGFDPDADEHQDVPEDIVNFARRFYYGQRWWR